MALLGNISVFENWPAWFVTVVLVVAAVIDGNFTSESTNLPELVSLEQRLQQARVWPYDMTIYLRVFLYASIGLSSWIGAALVERFLGSFFG